VHSDINLKVPREMAASIFNTESTLHRILETYNASRISMPFMAVVLLSNTQKVNSINLISMNEFIHNLEHVTK
jgi:hypothetical protein